MNITYCKQWFRGQKRELESLSPEQAREAYDSKELYTAVVHDKRRPICFVESKSDYIGVEFLDDRLRSYVAYQFLEKQPGRLFLSMAVFRKFDGTRENVVHGVVYYFKEDGHTDVDLEDDIAHEYYEASTTVDVSANWEPYPEFGQYESISRLERGLQLIH